MKKFVALIVGLFILGFSATIVSANEYEVKNGDSLWTIAKNNNTTVESLMDINDLNSSTIFPEQILKLEEGEKVGYYAVKQGDTLNIINKTQVPDRTEADTIPEQELVVNETKIVKEETKQLSNIVTEAEPETLITLSNTQEDEQNPVETKESETLAEPQGRALNVEATAYTAHCAGCSGITATGINLKENPNTKVIAVDPNVIPLGTKVYVEGYGYAIAGDTGGAIKGNKIDIHVPTKNEAFNWGRRMVEVTIVDE